MRVPVRPDLYCYTFPDPCATACDPHSAYSVRWSRADRRAARPKGNKT